MSLEQGLQAAVNLCLFGGAEVAVKGGDLACSSVHLRFVTWNFFKYMAGVFTLLLFPGPCPLKEGNK